MADYFESGITIGEKSWHGKEYNQQKDVKTVGEMLILGGIDWLVGTEPVYRLTSDGVPILIDEARATVRLSDNSTLGVVGPDWTPVQNADAFMALQPLVDSGYLKLATAGSVRNGRRVYMSGRIDGEIAEIVSGDPVEGYAVMYQGFDGKLKLAFKHTPTRVVCSNTLNIAISQGEGEGYCKDGVYFAHTANIGKRVEELKKNISSMASDFEKSIEAYRVTARRQVNPQVFFEKLLGIEERRIAAELAGEEASREGMITLSRLMEAYETQPGRQFAPGSGWQAYNAVTFFADHKRGREDIRKEMAWFGVGAKLKQGALQLALAA